MENHIKYSKGVCWISDCRIPFVDDGENKLVFDRSGKGGYRKEFVGCEIKEEYKWDKQQGRFAPNLLVCDDMLNDGSISKGQKNPRIQKTTRRYGENNFTNGGLFTPEGNITATYNDMGSSSRYYDLDKWFDKIIDEIR